MTDITIRTGTSEDVATLHAFITELAIFEKEPNAVKISVDQLRSYGFGDDARYSFYIAEKGGTPVGIALYYWAFSTWEGPYIHLEDLIVKEGYRGQQIGSKLFETMIALARKNKVRRLEWQVLDWNREAIDFYKKYDAEITSEWLEGRIRFDI